MFGRKEGAAFRFLCNGGQALVFGGKIEQLVCMFRTSSLVPGNLRLTLSAWKYSKGSSPDARIKELRLSIKVAPSVANGVERFHVCSSSR